MTKWPKSGTRGRRWSVARRFHGWRATWLQDRRRQANDSVGIAALADIPGLGFEFRADLDCITEDGGSGAITEWATTDYSVTLLPSGADSFFAPAVINGLPAVYFQGGRLTGALWPFITGAAATFVFVGQLTDLESQPGYPRFVSMYVTGGQDWDNPQSWTIATYVNGVALRVARNAAADLDVLAFDPALPVVAVLRRNGTSTSMVVKQPGLAVTVTGTTSTGDFNSDNFCIGGNPEENNMWGYVASVGYWPRALTDEETQAVINFMAEKYAI